MSKAIILVFAQTRKGVLRGKKVPREWLERTLSRKDLLLPPPRKKIWRIAWYLENVLPFVDAEIAELIFKTADYFGINIDVAGCIAKARAKGYA